MNYIKDNNNLTIKNIFLLIILQTLPFSVSSDVFRGEGKDGYINRCISTSELTLQSRISKREFCTCFATKLDKGYKNLIASLKPSDSAISIQRKMNSSAQKHAQSCMR